MGLLDDDYNDLYVPPKSRKYQKQSDLSQQQRDNELNNHDRIELTEDYSDSPFLDY